MANIAGVEFDERELKLIGLAKHYVNTLGGFGAPDHNYMALVVKLARIVEKEHEFVTDFWQGAMK